MKHWVFDLDGTLVDSFSHYFRSLDAVFREHGAQFTPELRQMALTEPLDKFFIQHLGQESLLTAFERLQTLSNDDARHIRPFTGLEEVVQQLLVRGARVAVWTNRDLVSASLILKHSGLSRLTETCVSGTCVAQRKPHPEGLLRLIDRFGCDAKDVTMVGDHEHDVMGAKAVGARAVRASWHAYWQEEDCRAADAQFRRITDFGAWALQ